MMQKEYAIYANEYGDASVLKYKQMPIRTLASDDVRVRNYYSDVNCTDIRFRTGRCRLSSLPGVLGIEGVGVVESVGRNVKKVHVGQRVAYAGLSAGSYASANTISEERLIALPSSLPSDVVASTLWRGMATYMLLTETYPVKRGDVVLVRSDNTSLMLILIQWLKALEATVIVVVDHHKKSAVMREHGADEVLTSADNIMASSVDYVIDGIGGDAFMQSVLAIKPGGVLAGISQAANGIITDEIKHVMSQQAIHFYRPNATDFMKHHGYYHQAANAVLEKLQQGLRPHIDAIIPFAQVRQAHERLESRRAMGAILLDTSIVRN